MYKLLPDAGMPSGHTPLALLLTLAAAPLLSGAPPTYNKDIAPILYDKCANCHRPGEVAPFSLLTYQDASKRAALIATVTKSRYMPVWKPEPGFGKFQHERRLTDEQIALLGEWASNGAPEGNPKDKPALPKFAEGWQAGEPNLVLKAGHGFDVPADGPDKFECFVLPLNLEQDSYIRTAEFRPGNRRVVHHGVIYVDETGAARKLAASGNGSYPCFGGPRVAASGLLGGWAPGTIVEPGDPKLSIPVKKGTDLVLQIHYHPSGKPETDTSSVGVIYGDPPSKGRTSLLMINTNIDIPPGESQYVVKSAMTMPQDVEVSGIFPHAHWLCKDMKLDARLPDGQVTHLIWIKDWDFNWQGGYRFEAPVHLPKGTRVEMAYTFDNSDKNTRNPSNPPARVTFGEQTTDEMAVAFLTVVLPTPADVSAFQKEMRLSMLADFLEAGDLNRIGGRIPGLNAERAQQMMKMFDKNGDGKLDADERAALIEFLRGMMK
jgi:mono/diheme cytochrome c family protein